MNATVKPRVADRLEALAESIVDDVVNADLESRNYLVAQARLKIHEFLSEGPDFEIDTRKGTFLVDHWACRALAASFGHSLATCGGPNYLELQMFDARRGNPLIVQIRKASAKEPAQAAGEALDTLVEVRDAIAAYNEELLAVVDKAVPEFAEAAKSRRELKALKEPIAMATAAAFSARWTWWRRFKNVLWFLMKGGS